MRIIGYIMKSLGKRNAGNPHVAFDGVGDGNGAPATAPLLDLTFLYYLYLVTTRYKIGIL